MRIALASARELPRPDADLPRLATAAADRGWVCETLAWDDPGAWSREHDLVLVRSTWDYLGKLQAFRAWISEAACSGRMVNAPQVMLWNLHKNYLLELSHEGVPIVATTAVRPGEQPDWGALFEVHGALVLKPAESAGSFATIRVADGDAGAAHSHRAEHAGRAFLVQPFLPSVLDRGETNLVFIGGRFSHAVRKGARWAGEPEQSRGLVEPTGDELDVAEAVLAATRRLGHGTPAYARVDLAIGRCGRPLLMELELVEPQLFLDRAPGSAERLLDAALASIGGTGR